MEKISCGGFYLGDGLNVEKDEFGRPVLNASGSGLPEVTAADNGKLLGVVEGEWGKVDGGLSVTAIALTTTEGAVTGGTATLSDGSTINITVSSGT